MKGELKKMPTGENKTPLYLFVKILPVLDKYQVK
jgi:hypothetical protein